MECVYMHIFPNGKMYIGTCGQDLETIRWNNGKGYKTRKMREAIARFGWENVRHKIIAKGIPTTEMAHNIETLFILQFNTVENGYNTTYGKGDVFGYEEGFKNGRISAFEEARRTS